MLPYCTRENSLDHSLLVDMALQVALGYENLDTDRTLLYVTIHVSLSMSPQMELRIVIVLALDAKQDSISLLFLILN